MRYIITAIGSMSAKSVIDSIYENDASAEILGLDINEKQCVALAGSVDSFYKSPYASSPEYIPFLKSLLNEEITIVIPLTDPEVDTIVEELDQFKNLNVKFTIALKEVVELCRNKLNWSEVLSAKQGIDIIPTVKYEHLSDLPEGQIIAKVINGRSSEGLKRYFSPKDVPDNLDKNYIFQPFIEGEIFTVDILRDQFGQTVSVPRIELTRTSNGAGLSVRVEAVKELISLSRNIAEILGLTGCMNIEFIKSRDRFFIMDINPRFSAGIAFTKLAGYDMVWNTIRQVSEQEIQLSNSIETITASKYYTEKITTL